MNVGEIRNILERSLDVKVPRFDPNTAPGLKIDKIQDYILETADHRAQLESALYWLWEAEKLLKDQWDDIEVGGMVSSKATAEDTRQAKRRVSREIHDGLRELHGLKEHLGRQIRRLERDYESVSRWYTVVTGGS